MFPEINPEVLTQAFPSSHDTPRQRNVEHLKSSMKEVERIILKCLHHLFSLHPALPDALPESVFIPIPL